MDQEGETALGGVGLEDGAGLLAAVERMVVLGGGGASVPPAPSEAGGVAGGHTVEGMRQQCTCPITLVSAFGEGGGGNWSRLRACLIAVVVERGIASLVI